MYSSVANGNYAITVTATNGTLTRSTTVQVTIGTTGTSPAGSINLPLTTFGVAAVAIVAAVGVTVFLIRRKSK